MIGPDIPAHLLNPAPPDDDDDDDEPKAGPSSPPRSTTPPVSIGPSIPAHLVKPTQPAPADEEEEDEDAFLPALPPDLPAPGPTTSSEPARQIGPTFPQRPPKEHESDSDDDYGPMPLPAGLSAVEDENDGVREFIERERRREQQIEEAKQPKALKRDDWMLAPPSSSDMFSSLDPTKLKNRQFSRSTTDKKSAASNLWTETPQERQQRLADEISGKRKRAENATTDAPDEDVIKRRKRDEELRAQVEAHNKATRAESLVAMHSAPTPNPDDAPPGIWDHSRDMGLGGRLMDEKSRSKMLKDAKGLGDRFGHGQRGGFL